MSAAVHAFVPSQSGWRRVKLGDICSKPQYGWTTKATKTGTGPKFLRTTDITGGQIDWATVPFCAESPADVEKYLVRNGDILISRAGSVGVSHLVTSAQPAVFASYLIRFKPGSEVLPKYLAYFLDSPSYWKQIASNTAGIAVPNVNASKLAELELPLAPLDEQARIVAEIEKQFSRLDEAVVDLKRVITRLTGYRQRVLDDAFASEPNAALGELICAGPQNGLYLPKGAYGSGTPIVRIDDYQTDWIRPLGDLRRVRVTLSQASTWALQPGDLLVNRVNSLSHLGKCMVVPDALAGALFESNMMRFRLLSGVLPRYVELYLGSRIGKQRLTANAKWAVNQASINQKDVQATEIPLPHLDHQAQIVAELDHRLSVVRGVEAEVDANQKRAQALRQAVLSKRFLAPSPGVA